jgi:Rieske 2Fe-2S family protein
MSDPRIPLVRQSDLDAVLPPVESARNLPGAVYLEPEVFALERDVIFTKSWICVGRQEALDVAGAFMTVEVAGHPVLLTRGEDGAVHAFHNACRHRGACITQEKEGVARSFRCNYHGWTYAADGGLLAAPLMEERADFVASEHGLVPVRLERWGGFLFVNLDADAEPLATAMAGFPNFDRYDLESLRRVHSVTYKVGANWKILCENYSECYHCALVHPQLNRVTDFRSGGNSFEGGGFNGGPMALKEGYTTMSMTGQREHPEIEGITDDDRGLMHYAHFYPSFLIGLAPDYIVLHTLNPVSVEESRVTCEWFYPVTTVAIEGFDASAAIEFWDITNRQDWGLCEMVQKGAAARFTPGPYHPLEYCAHAFDKWFVERLGPRLAALRR